MAEKRTPEEVAADTFRCNLTEQSSRVDSGNICVAIVGSSGGGAATLGHGDAFKLLTTIKSQVEAIEDVICAHAIFVASSTPLDVATRSSHATIWNIIDGEPKMVLDSSLEMIDTVACAQDELLAKAITNGEVQALVMISSDPTDVNNKVTHAAAKAGIPVVGSGGTSVSKAMELGVSFAGSFGGSVATTSLSRAISYAAGLARHWGCPYKPVALTPAILPRLHSIMDGCLPAFLCVLFLRSSSEWLRWWQLEGPADYVGELLAAGTVLAVKYPIIPLPTHTVSPLLTAGPAFRIVSVSPSSC
jgi:hypothetical protein